MLGGTDASVNLVAEGDLEAEEDEDLYVNVARIRQEEDDWQEPDDLWLELEEGESEEEAGVYCVSACMRKDDSRLENELDYFHDITPPPQRRRRLWKTGGGLRSCEDHLQRRRTRRITSTSMTFLWVTSRSRGVS